MICVNEETTAVQWPLRPIVFRRRERFSVMTLEKSARFRQEWMRASM